MKKPSTIPEIVDNAAQSWPDRICIRSGDESYTYGYLHKLSLNVHENLLRLGCRPGDRVAFQLEKSIESVAIMIGACRAACAYVPIDPSLAPQKVQHILDDCSPRLFVSEGHGVDVTGCKALQPGELLAHELEPPSMKFVQGRQQILSKLCSVYFPAGPGSRALLP